MKICIHSLCLYAICAGFVACTSNMDNEVRIPTIERTNTNQGKYRYCYDDDRQYVCVYYDNNGQIENVSIGDSRKLTFLTLNEEGGVDEVVIDQEEHEGAMKFIYEKGILKKVIEYSDYSSRVVNQIYRFQSVIDTVESNFYTIKDLGSHKYYFTVNARYKHDRVNMVLGEVDISKAKVLNPITSLIEISENEAVVEVAEDKFEGLLQIEAKVDSGTIMYPMYIHYPQNELLKFRESLK